MERLIRPSEIKPLRVKLGLTQAQLARLSGVTQAYIAKIEAGLADPKISTIERISNALARSVPARSGGKKGLTAEQMMTSPIIHVKRGDTIRHAIKLMRTHDISQLPVLEGGIQVGSISEAILMKKITAGGNVEKLVRSTVERMMEAPFPTVNRDTNAYIVYSILEHSPAVLVVDRSRAVGIITKADVLRLMVKPKHVERGATRKYRDLVKG